MVATLAMRWAVLGVLFFASWRAAAVPVNANQPGALKIRVGGLFPIFKADGKKDSSGMVRQQGFLMAMKELQDAKTSGTVPLDGRSSGSSPRTGARATRASSVRP